MKHSLGHLFLLAVCVLVCGTESSSQALNISDETKIYASDAVGSAEFGASVDIDGDVAIVGAFKGRQGVQQTGSAYLYDVTTGQELFQLIAGDEFHGDRFGFSVAVSGDTAIVGAPFDDDHGSSSGSAYLFDITTGNLLHKLTATDAAVDNEFGRSVAISGNIAIVSGHRNDHAGSSSGSAYLFDVTNGNQLFKLTATDAAAGDNFGRSVDISGNTAIIGALGNDDNGSESGSAYLFDVITGNQLHKLTASDGTSGDWFGVDVAISNNTAIVGANFDNHTTVSAGSAYLFDVSTGNQLHKLTASDADIGDNFGFKVNIDGNHALVGANGNNDENANYGTAYVFDLTTGDEIQRLIASDTQHADAFGNSVAISDRYVIVGADGDDDFGFNSGAAYIYRITVPEPQSVSLFLMQVLFVLARPRTLR